MAKSKATCPRRKSRTGTGLTIPRPRQLAGTAKRAEVRTPQREQAISNQQGYWQSGVLEPSWKIGCTGAWKIGCWLYWRLEFVAGLPNPAWTQNKLFSTRNELFLEQTWTPGWARILQGFLVVKAENHAVLNQKCSLL